MLSLVDERQTSRTQNKVLKSLVLVLVLVQPALKESDQERNQDTEIRTNMFSFGPDQPSSDAGKRVMIGSDRRLLCKTWT